MVCVFCAFFISPVFATLPAGYTELEYIESTGTQYIDTGQMFLFGDEFYFEYMQIKSVSTENKGYGAGVDLSSNITCGGRKKGDIVGMYTLASNTYYSPTLSYQDSLNKHYTEQWKISEGTLVSVLTEVGTDNIYTFSAARTGFNSSYTSGNTVYLFRDHSSLYDYYSATRLYHTWLRRQNGTYVFDFIPAKRDSDNEIGMYDTVTNTFFTNKGTGDFIAGPVAEIKIATTKMVDEEFKAAEDQLAATVQTIESVVSRTIAQTEQIQILQDTKQTRPDESCPANTKCLLVQDEDGTPHWYPIIEP
ncbi:MAG: hypothetical protein KBT14_01320 [Proteobacteria bacterium]|nr:hypothetical protein [Candidatus Enterousia onthequi]